MGKVIGIGGAFLKASDPRKLAAWYQEILGVGFNNGVYAVFPLVDEAGVALPGYNILSFFKQESDYFKPSTKEVMLNLRVSGLFELIEELRSKNVEIVGEPVDDQFGKFGWILDPEGNKIELWEPPVT